MLGILSLVMCGVFAGIPAWIMGNGDLREMDANAMDPSGRSLTNAGRIMGMVSCILTLVGLVVVVLLFALGFLGAFMSHR